MLAAFTAASAGAAYTIGRVSSTAYTVAFVVVAFAAGVQWISARRSQPSAPGTVDLLFSAALLFVLLAWSLADRLLATLAQSGC